MPAEVEVMELVADCGLQSLTQDWILVNPTAGVSFQGIYCEQVALLLCLCSSKVKGRRREKGGGLFAVENANI